MSKAIYFDTFNGVAGDMILGALIDLGVSPQDLVEGLKSLQMEAFEIRSEEVFRQGLRGVDARVVQLGKEVVGKPGGGQASHRKHRNFTEILNLIEGSELPDGVKDRATRILRRLGEAEAEVHGASLEEVHFHEVGEIDSIVDIVGSCLGFHLLEVDEFYTSPLALGGGTVRFSHGDWPVPAPATERLVRGFPCRMGPVLSELTTPTGAAIVTTLARPDAQLPVWIPTDSGFGAGDRAFESIPNMLRLLLSEIPQRPAPVDTPEEEEISVLETSIDDMDPESLAYFQELALREGALDVYYSSLHMKKGRPGVLLTVLCRNEERDRLARLAFHETSTLGLRWKTAKRWVLERESVQVSTPLGTITVKVGRYRGRVINVWPEYEELRQLARSQKIPLKLARRKVFEALKELDYE